jgi:hypothetical protein
MSKESGGFLRKVVRFVANPTTDWTELDAPSGDSAESDYAKTEIKAMVERKRRNDFVRKRELDMLRKIRREGLNQDAAMALSGPSDTEPDSRPQTGTRSDIAVKAKIDEIELQMVGGSNRPSSTLQPAAVSSRPGRLVESATTAPNTLTVPAAPHLDDEPPQISQAVLDAARESILPRRTTSGTLPGRGERLATDMDVDVQEMAHDPDLDEAVMAFANADFDQCERSLLALVQPGALRHEQIETWLVLFDLYRALDLPQKFDHLAVSFAQKFGISAPQWYSIPQRVAHFLARQSRAGEAEDVTEPLPSDPGPATEPMRMEIDAQALEGWVAPPTLDQDTLAQLRIEVLQMPRPWIMDWSHVTHVTAEGAAQLGLLMRAWAREAHEMIWSGTDHLLDVLGDLSPSGCKDVDPAYWMLRMDILRLANRPVQFDEVAIEYCLTYELSPPSWEHAACRVTLRSNGVSPHTRPLSHISEVTTTFVESELHNEEIEFVQVAALNLSGQLVGDIGQTLSRLDDQLSASTTLEIDCDNLLRVDFIAAGDLLNWVLARRAEERQVVFNRPHRLIALFFGAMGITEHARGKVAQA